MTNNPLGIMPRILALAALTLAAAAVPAQRETTPTAPSAPIHGEPLPEGYESRRAPAPTARASRSGASARSAVAPGRAPDSSGEVPADFARFSMPGHDETAATLNRFLRHHFSTRAAHHLVTLFTAEYLTLADMWVGGARDPRSGLSIQRTLRNALLAVELDEEGYVHTHQHISHAHDDGWPFPLWTQAGVGGPEAVAGRAAGWHFQTEPPEWAWVWTNYLQEWDAPQFKGESATRDWELAGLESRGIVDNRWALRATARDPRLTSPEGIVFEAFQAPFLQLRWRRTGEIDTLAPPYIEWRRDGDDDFSPERRVYLQTGPEDESAMTGARHTLARMYTHPLWEGPIARVRLALAPGEGPLARDDTGNAAAGQPLEFEIDSFFTVYDTRHPINNPLYVRACENYFRWSGDLDFLRRALDPMRRALRHHMTVFGATRDKSIQVNWPGHDGRPGWTGEEGEAKTLASGHGIGNNYLDLLPFGGWDMAVTAQYYGALLSLARLEELARARPEYGLPRGALALEPATLLEHAAEVKAAANERFWNPETGRFVASEDLDGNRWDFGFVTTNQEAIWYGIASEPHARSIMDWIGGGRIVAGDTSTGADIYRWRFGPRTTTRRNVEWWSQVWTGPDTVPFGDQVQDGGAVLGLSFFDLWARLTVEGPDSAWRRLGEIVQWERDVWAAGGYDAFYAAEANDGKPQGSGEAGGLGIDDEFFESSLLPSIAIYGFMGLDPRGDTLVIEPRLPAACPRMGVENLWFRGELLTVEVEPDEARLALTDDPALGFEARLGDRSVRIDKAGEYRLKR